LELKTLNTISKKKYVCPVVTIIRLDNTISMVMMSSPIDPPPPPFGTSKKEKQPFDSPFNDKPFS
jgi:hypothetical protein